MCKLLSKQKLKGHFFMVLGAFLVISLFINTGTLQADQYICAPENIANFGVRVHVKCTVAATGGIRYFAVSTEDKANAARVLGILSIATVMGRNVGIDYNPNDTSGSTIGCQTGDCRLIRWLWLTP